LGAHVFLTVAKGCCPGKDVRSPSNFRAGPSSALGVQFKEA